MLIKVLHSHKIVHRDLKAENIMSHNGTYKIIDFGFSKKLQISQENTECRNTSLGTITTMAPEVMGRKSYGLKVHIALFRLIYGQSASYFSR
jgi:serine/threonine protein kinase